MPVHEIKTCSRCNTEFECKVGSVLLCQCQGIKLTHAQRAYIALRYVDCLCARCLIELRSECNQVEHEGKIAALVDR